MPTKLPRLATEEPLPPHRPAAEMYWRLIDDCPATASPQASRHPEAAYVPEHVRRPHEPPPSVTPDRSGRASPYR